jgi:HSP20 family molecular chaperone IbpA
MSSGDSDAWMWERAKAKLERAGRERTDVVRLEDPDAGRPGWEPAVDLFVAEEGVTVLVALSGVDLESVEAEVEGSTLHLRGDRPNPDVPRDAVLHRMEIPCGPFQRRVELPPGVYELAGRRSLRGCLVVELKRDPQT